VSPPAPAATRGRQRLFAAIAVGLGLALGFALLEIGLAALRRQIESSDRLQPGLTRYDEGLGWRLSPGWLGSHLNHDFDVRYSINAEGLRGPALSAGQAGTVAYLGDRTPRRTPSLTTKHRR